ncbi:MAG TPA: type II toxin-antitoxin system VapB family antitoxin [Chloroflexota bacterium]|jgi:hypothetical protein
MRTTVNIDDQLLAETKVLAGRSGKTLTAVIEDALRERLARQPATTLQEQVLLLTVGGHGLLPGVDLDDSAALQDLMDGPA